MARLRKEELGERLRLDYQVAMGMRCAAMDVTAHHKSEDLRAQRNLITSEVNAHLASHYRACYRIKTLVGRDRYAEHTAVHFDLLANGNYPYSEPGCWVVSSPMPWSPHFKKGYPICIGEIWKEAKGNILLGHLLIHVARLLNFDEAARGGGYRGWNGAAINFWQKQLHGRPITSGLVYPALPVDLTHGLTPGAEGAQAFRVGRSSGGAHPLSPSVFQVRPGR